MAYSIVKMTAQMEQNDFVGRLVEMFKNYVLSVRTYNELNALTDAQLRDIGINRGDIARLAKDV